MVALRQVALEGCAFALSAKLKWPMILTNPAQTYPALSVGLP